MKYDALTGTEEDYSLFVAWLETQTAASLQQAKGDRRAIATAITTYLETGYNAHLTPGELTDFFCVDTPNILDKAGYFEADADLAIELYDEINTSVVWKSNPN